MIRIYLDGKLAIPKENQTIKLTSENFYFTKSASYTYDIELPLAIAENRAIFGNINRMDMEKEARKMEAFLIVDNIPVLVGTAHITSVSETSVKVQLLGEAASYNYGNKMDETYIDELDLGNWYMVTWPDGSHWSRHYERWEYYPADTKFTGNSGMVFQRAQYNDDGTRDKDNLFRRIYNGTYPWVAFPVMNTNADFLCNAVAYHYVDKDTVKPYFRGFTGSYRLDNHEADNVTVSSSIQPFVCIIAELIAKATGYTLRREDNDLYTNPFLKRIFIVTANNMIECNRCLPHWSVNDFWTNVENAFGVILSVDYANKRMSLRQRGDHYRNVAPTVCLRNVVDEYSVEIDDETRSDLTAGNVGFADFDNDPADLLDEFILKHCEVNMDFADISELLTWAHDNRSNLRDYKGTLFKCKDRRQFIITEAQGIVEVNQFRPRIADESKEEADIDIELKFVPAQLTDGECPIYGSGLWSDIGGFEDLPIGSFPVRMLHTPDISDMTWYKHSGYSAIDIEAILNEEEEETTNEDDKNDVIYIAMISDKPWEELTVDFTFIDKTTIGGQNVTFPRPVIRERSVAKLSDPGGPHIEDAPLSLSLIPIEGQENLAKNTIAGAAAIATGARQCIKFVADRIPDPTAIFLIHNRRFVCEKIEADIATSGLKKLMTGYFYELNL